MLKYGIHVCRSTHCSEWLVDWSFLQFSRSRDLVQRQCSTSNTPTPGSSDPADAPSILDGQRLIHQTLDSLRLSMKNGDLEWSRWCREYTMDPKSEPTLSGQNVN